MDLRERSLVNKGSKLTAERQFALRKEALFPVDLHDQKRLLIGVEVALFLERTPLPLARKSQ